VVAKTRDRLDAARADIDRITGRLAALPPAQPGQAHAGQAHADQAHAGQARADQAEGDG
jgi:hypothetical protein